MVIPLENALDIHFSSLHQILRSLYEKMSPLCDDIATFATVIAGLGALFYIGYRVWQALARVEAIDVFGLLRPFVIGLCIIGFRPIVIDSINGILSPLVVGTNQMLQEQLMDMKKLQEMKDRLQWEADVRKITLGYVDPSADYDKELRELGLDTSTQSVMDVLYEISQMATVEYWVTEFFRMLLELLFGAAALVIDTLRTFYLVILTVLGPIAFAISIFDGFQSTLTFWLARYIQIYIWLPIADLFSAMLAKIQTISLDRDIELIGDNSFLPDTANAVYLIFLLISIIGYFTIPTVAGWIVQSTGAGGYNRRVNTIGNTVANVGAGAAGAATGNVSGSLMK